LDSDSEAVFSIEEFCAFAKISHETLQRYRRRNEGPAELKLGSARRILKSDGVEWLKSLRYTSSKQGSKVSA
jgi:hypothetical protein